MVKLSQIMKYLTEIQPQNSISSDCSICNVSLYDPSEPTLPCTLYVGRSSQMSGCTGESSCAFFVIQDSRSTLSAIRGNVSLFSSEVSLSHLYRTTAGVLLELNQLSAAQEKLLSLHLNKSGLEALVNAASDYLGNPVLVYGITADLLAHSMDSILRSIPDPILQEVLTNGHMSSRQLRENGTVMSRRLNRYGDSSTPRIYQDQSYAGYRRTTLPIQSNSQQLGLLTVVEVLKTFPRMQNDYIALFHSILALELEVQLTAGMDQQLIDQLMEGVFSTPESFYARAIPFGWIESDNNQLVFFQSETPGEQVNFFVQYEKHFNKILEKHFSFFRILNQKNYVILLISNAEPKQMDSFLEEMDEILKGNNVLIGVSQNFADISKLPMYFSQTRTLIDIGRRISPHKIIYRFWDYSIHYLLELLRQNNYPLEQFCVPALKTVAEYDRQNHSELSKTVRCYLYHAFNSTATAEALQIHRNTVTRRLDQFCEVSGLDLNDTSVSLQLLLSYKIIDLLNA